MSESILAARVSRRKFFTRTAGAATLSVLPRAAFGRSGHSDDSSPGAELVHAPAMLRVHATPSRVVNSFDPDKSLGSSMDELSPSIVGKIFTPEIIRESLSASWGPITYRLHTELAIEAWH
jgi:hypothetical protein